MKAFQKLVKNLDLNLDYLKYLFCIVEMENLFNDVQ